MREKWLELTLLSLILLVLVGVPLAVKIYDQRVWNDRIPSGAKEFTLTGHAQRGWMKGEVGAWEAVSLWHAKGPVEAPTLEVSLGDRVVFKLRSSDVIHGFSLKDFGVFVNDGIQPGKALLVSFTADKVGRFIFSCNAICGDRHEVMQGTLVVRA